MNALAGRGMPIGDAAKHFGVTTQAIRKRIKRGTLLATKGEDGTWTVYLPDDDPVGDTDQDAGRDVVAAASIDALNRLVAQLESENTYLRTELSRVGDQHAESERRRDILLSRFAETLEALPHTTTSPDTIHRRQRAEPSETPKRSWWRELFGFPA